MTEQQTSLRRLLFSKLSVFILPMVLAMLIGGYYAIYYYINVAFDRSLARRVYALADQVVVVDGKATVELSQSAHDILEFDSTDVLYYRVIGPAGENLTGTNDLPLPQDLPVSQSGKAFFYDTTVDGDQVRAAGFLMSLQGTHAVGDVLVIAGETMDKRTRLAGDVLAALALPMALFVGLLIYAVNKGIEISLRPIDSLREAISRRSPQDLSPLTVKDMPDEIRPLLAEMNRLVGDLAALHESRHRFLANAAHQLRTPLAAMRAQTELALRNTRDSESRDALKNLLPTLDRQAHLVGQLLALSRAENMSGGVAFARLDLALLAREVVSDWVPRSLELGLDIVFEAPDDPVWVEADRNSIIEALSNLLDNATRYSAKGAVITVTVSQDSGKACLSVIDTGPGVPPDQQEKIFDRFYRVPGSQGEGCGLGLAIVRQIARSHGGEAEVREPREGARGFEICMRLPLCN